MGFDGNAEGRRRAEIEIGGLLNIRRCRILKRNMVWKSRGADFVPENKCKSAARYAATSRRSDSYIISGQAKTPTWRTG